MPSSPSPVPSTRLSLHPSVSIPVSIPVSPTAPAPAPAPAPSFTLTPTPTPTPNPTPAPKAPAPAPAPAPSPEPTAAMSLGALAAAATLAAAASSSSPRAPSYPVQYGSAPPSHPTFGTPSAPPRPVAPRLAHVHTAAPSQPVPPAPPAKPKQRRYRATPDQLRHLIARFDLNPSPTSPELHALAAAIAMPPQSVVLWFKNRRARVPHKKAEKAMAAKRRADSPAPPSASAVIANAVAGPKSDLVAVAATNSDVEVPLGASPASISTAAAATAASATAASATGAAASNASGAVMCGTPDPALAAAASMAEMAMALAAGPRQAGRNITNQTGRTASFPPTRSPNRSPVGRHYVHPENIMPYDDRLVKRLSRGIGGGTNGAEFVHPVAGGTPRRPRLVPATPRLFSQREYHNGDCVEVLETSKGICRAWYSAVVVGRAGPKELSLGASAADACRLHLGSGGSAGAETEGVTGQKRVERKEVIGNGDTGGGDSPRTVRSPAASGAASLAKVVYTVEYVHRKEEGEGGRRMREEVGGSRMRPCAPGVGDAGPRGEWRPEAGEAVEVLRDGAWFVGVVQTFVVRKGYLVSFECGDVEWVRRPRLRAYQIWRGGDLWVTKMKPPLPVVRKSVGLSVTHPPGGKRKRSGFGCGSGGVIEVHNGSREGGETRERYKRGRSMCMDRSGPDGLPEGWRVDYARVAGTGGGASFYVAPDGVRLRSLKEAQRYVQMMGPA